MDREDIKFQGEGGLTLRGWFYPAKNTSTPAPVIVLAHGLSCVKEMHLDDYAVVFSAAGLNVLAYDRGENKRVHLSIPLWLLHMKGKMKLQGEDMGVERLELSVDDIEKAGPALLIDHADGHARLLVNQPNQLEVAMEVIEKGWSVRQLEQDMREDGARQAAEVRREWRDQQNPIKPTRGVAGKDADTRALERRLTDALGLEVTIDHRGEKGTLSVKYTDLDQLDAVIKKLGG